MPINTDSLRILAKNRIANRVKNGKTYTEKQTEVELMTLKDIPISSCQN